MLTSSAALESILRLSYRTARQTGATLYDVLDAGLAARTTEAAGGRTITATAGNGHSVSFSDGDGKAIGIEAARDTYLELVRCHEASNTALIAAGTSSPTDAQIYAEMLARIAPVDTIRADFSAVRENNGGRA